MRIGSSIDWSITPSSFSGLRRHALRFEQAGESPCKSLDSTVQQRHGCDAARGPLSSASIVATETIMLGAHALVDRQFAVAITD
jgi:hypothetical protein